MSGVSKTGDVLSKKSDVYLFNYENGETTNQFVKLLLDTFEDDITFRTVSTSTDAKKELLLVTVVRSVSVRYEDDLDFALETIKREGFLQPKVIIYFHKHGCSNCSVTGRDARGNIKYKDIVDIIDMDFSDENFCMRYYPKSHKKEVNKSARDRLVAAVQRLEVTVNNVKQLVYLYDSSNTEHSQQFIMELKLMMKGTYEIESRTVDTNKILDAVICDANEFPHEQDTFKGSDPVFFVLHKGKIKCETKEPCVIDVPLPDENSLIRVNYKECKQFDEFVKFRKARNAVSIKYSKETPYVDQKPPPHNKIV